MRESSKADRACDLLHYHPNWLTRQAGKLREADVTKPNRADRAEAGISKYREYPPPLPLKGHLMCLWTQSVTGSENPYAHRVLPDGCIDIVFMNHEPPVVVGPYLKCFIARLPPGAVIVGARFHPGRAIGLLGHPASVLLNQSVPLNLLWNDAARARFSWLAGKTTCADRLAALEAALLSRMAQAAPLDPAVTAVIEWLAGHPEGRVEQLSRWTGMSNRQLRRRFSAAVGYNPKVFQEVLRFQGLLNLAAHSRQQLRLADLSVLAGYADQAHMSREVHRFSDIHPRDLLGSAGCTLCLSGLIKTSRAFQRK